MHATFKTRPLNRMPQALHRAGPWENANPNRMPKTLKLSTKQKRARAVAPGQLLGYGLQYTRLTAMLLESPAGSFCSIEVLDDVAAESADGHMAQVVGAANGRLQGIVLDHAPRDVWENIPNIVAFEEWRDGKTLVPAEWLT